MNKERLEQTTHELVKEIIKQETNKLTIIIVIIIINKGRKYTSNKQADDRSKQTHKINKQ